MINIQCLTIDCHNPLELAEFWAEALSWSLGDGASDNEAYIERNLEPNNTDGYPDILFIKTPDKKTQRIDCI